MVCDEVGHGLGGLEPCSSCARATGRGRFANEAAGAQICQGVDLIDGNEARDATATHCHDHLGAVLDVLDVAAEAVVQLADAHLSFQRFGMWRHNGHCTRYIDGRRGFVSMHQEQSAFAAGEVIMVGAGVGVQRPGSGGNGPATGCKTGYKLSATRSNSEHRAALRSTESHPTELEPSGWGPGGRRFKSCLADTKCLVVTYFL